MRAKTVKRLAILIAVFLLGGGSAFAIWKFQVGRMARGVVEQADQAVEKKDYALAVDLYQQHLLVFPDDLDVSLKYADVLLKWRPTPKNQENVMAIYNEVLKRQPGRAEVRRRAAELALKMPGNLYEVARGHLTSLLKSARDDGQLEYLMGRCCEEDKDPENAASYFRAAIAHRAPDRPRASQRLATLIREHKKLGTPEDADQVIDEMVQADPGDSQVYLQRGRYRGKFGLAGAEGDFQKSLEIAPDQPETYVEFAQLAERNKALDESRRALDQHRPFTFALPERIDVARQILDIGLAALPYSPALYQARAELERKAGRVDRFIEIVEGGVKKVPQQTSLHLSLAQMLAARGDTGKLYLHIEELKALGAPNVFIDYLIAYYYVNNKEFERARRALALLQTSVGQIPELKARVNVLLAKCYGQLHEPDKQREANQRAFDANPNDVAAHLGWLNGQIDRLVGRGEIDEAIREYQQQLERAPYLDRMVLVRLMLMRNQQRPPAQRDWRGVEALLDDLIKASPNSVDLVVRRAMLHAEQDQPAKAREALEAAHSRFPQAVEPWTAQAELLMREKQFDKALVLLDHATTALGGDRIEIRLTRASVWVNRGAPEEEVVKVLNGLAKDLDPFPKEKRQGLLAYLAGELAAHQDVEGAERLWLRLAEEDRENLNPHLQLFDLALKNAMKAGNDQQAEQRARVDIEAQIKAIEGIDRILGRFCQARYLTWQAAPKGEIDGKEPRPEGPAARPEDEVERKKLRAEARALWVELKTQREEWELIPVAEAALEEQDLAEAGPDEARKREMRESLVALYLSAIELGSRNPTVMRRAVELLIATGRSLEAIQLLSRTPVAPQLGNDLMRMAARVAGAQNENDQLSEEIARKAEEIARKAVAAKPDNLQDRLWLATILMSGKRIDEAEAQLRAAVAQADGDPVRWQVLVNFLIQNKQLPKAEQALRDAEKKLPPTLPQSPLALAECCELLGRANEAPDTIAQAKKWYAEARQWFDKAGDARKGLKDATVLRRLVQFLRHADPIEAEKQLKAILGQGSGAQDASTLVWARRTLASLYISRDLWRPSDALALIGAAAPRGAGADPEDRRVRAQVLAAQGTPEHRRQAIECLESLVNEGLAAPEDLLLLARLAEAEDWPKSRDQYRKLIERIASNTSDPDRRKRQIVFLGEFAEKLLHSHQPAEDKDKDLAEAQEQIEKLKRLQPDLMESLKLEVELHAARNDLEGAAALIASTARRAELNTAVLPQLARMAEKIGPFDQFKLAEEIYRKIASAPAAPFYPNKAMLVQFLTRRGRFTDALDLCEPLRKDADVRGQVDQLCTALLSDSSIPLLPEQAGPIDRLIGWLKEEVRNGQQSLMYPIGLGNLYERIGRDALAEETYRAVVNSNDRDGVASNNLAWLMALNSDRWNEALDLINHAIKTKGSIPDYLDTRGVVYLYMGQSDRAIADLTAAVKAQPTASKYFHLAQAYLIKKDKPNARKNLEAAMTKGSLPNGLHRLEIAKYKKVRDELGMP